MNPMDILRKEALDSVGERGNELHFQPAPEGKGDMALPCFAIAKRSGKGPAETAAHMAEGFKRTEHIERAVAYGPYLNFFADRESFSELVLREIESGGLMRADRKGMKVIVEHTSANPTGPLHVGRARNPIIGDTVARIMRRAGYDVETEYYVDDMGKQAVMVAWGIEHFGRAKEGERPDRVYVGHYRRANELMEANEEAAGEISSWIRRYENGDKEIRERVRDAVNQMMSGILDSLERLDIHLDTLAYESDIVFSGSVEEVIGSLKGKGVLKADENGALYIDLADYGVKGRDTRFFITRSDGTTLYSTRDVAYHINKEMRSDIMVDVLGEDHRLQSKAVSILLDILGHRKPEVLFYAFVGLPEGRMSTRKGRVVYLDDLLDEAVSRAYQEVKKRRSDLDEKEMRRVAEAVGISAVRYGIIRVQPEKRMTFRWEDALNFEGDSAPFIQYSYARASSIIRKAGDFERKHSVGSDGEWRLLMHMAAFQDMIEESAAKMRPQILPAYLRDMASIFNDFYRDFPVLSAPEPLRSTRLTLVDAWRSVMREGMVTAGLRPLERM